MRALTLTKRYPRLLRMLRSRRDIDPIANVLLSHLAQGDSLDRVLPEMLRRLLVEREVMMADVAAEHAALRAAAAEIRLSSLAPDVRERIRRALDTAYELKSPSSKPGPSGSRSR